MVFLEIKALESSVNKKEELSAQIFVYDSDIVHEQNETIEKRKDNEVSECDTLKSQNITKTPKCTSQLPSKLNLGVLEQDNDETSKLDNITTDSSKTGESNPLLNPFALAKVMDGSTSSNAGSKVLINSITVDIDHCQCSKNDESKPNFNYTESLKTPNPDFGDKKLSDTTDYIEDEPPTPLLYENISKDLAEPDCAEVKTVSFIKEMVRDNADDNVDTPTNFIDKITVGDENLNKDKEPMHFVQEINTEESKSNEDISKSEDFIRAMITGESTTGNSHQQVLTKADDFIKKMLTSDNIKNKVEERVYLRELITKDSENISKRHESSDLVQELMNEKTNIHEDAPKTEDFIKEIISGVSNDANYKETEKEGGNYDENNKIDQNNSSDSCLDYHIQERKHEKSDRTQQQKNVSDSTELDIHDRSTDLETHDREEKSANISPTNNEHIKTNDIKKKSIQKDSSISFLSEIPSVTDATNNFMNQIIDTKAKTSHLIFMDDLSSKQSK